MSYSSHMYGNFPILIVFVALVISKIMSNSEREFSELLQDLLAKTGTSVDEALKALQDMRDKVGLL